MCSRFLASVRGLVTRGRAERELDEELRFHLEMETEANVARGLPPAEARRVALRDLGGVDQTAESVRRVRSMWFDTLSRDVHLAARRIRRQPVVSACIILLVALGVAVTAAVFSVADGVIFKPLPFPHSEQLIAFGGQSTRSEVPFEPMSPQEYRAVADSPAVKCAVVFASSWSDSPEDAAEFVGADVTPGLFEMLQVRPVAGRTLADADSARADRRSVVIGYDLWHARFDGDPSIIGRPVDLGTRRFVVVGVMPRGFDFPNGANVWSVAVLVPKPSYERFHYLQVVGRLRPGLSRRDAERELTQALGREVRAVPLRDWVRPRSSRALVLFVAGASLVLLLSWVEVACLQLTRAASMHAELGLRLALGAARRQVLVQCAVEGVVLALAALVCAGIAAPALLSATVAFLPPDVVRGQPIAVDLRVLAFASGVALLGVLAFTLVPAHVLRSASPGTALRGLGSEGCPRSPDRMRNGLLVAQVALSCAVVYLGGVAIRSYREVERVELGFRPDGLVGVTLPGSTEETPEVTLQRFTQAVAAVREVPGVRAVSGSAFRPFARGTILAHLSRRGVGLDKAVAANRSVVSPGFISTVGGRLTAGRDFDEHDRRGAPLAVILNETAARLVAAGGDVVGREVLVDGLPSVVVGIARDMRMVRPDLPAPPLVYSPNAQWLPPSWLFARLDANDAALRERVRQTVGRLWTVGRPVVVDVAADAEQATAPYRMRMQLLAVVAATGVLLATIGLYGGVMFVVRQRTREYAIRMALGAAPGAIQRSVAVLCLRVALSGVAAGLAAGGLAVRAMPEILFNVPVVDGVTAGAVAVMAAAVALGAAALPARRAATIQPAEALRQE